MNSKEFSDAMNEIDEKYIDEAVRYKRKTRKSGWLKWGAAAACIVIVFVIGSIFAPTKGGLTVTAYAHGTDEEISAAGAVMSSGTISDQGEMKGHPLMFYLAGKDIASVRFSCKNQQINFMDWTEQRDEYGNAQNFTVAYGEDESEYYYLTIDWVPDTIIRELTDNESSTIATLPEEMRSDIIVMEIAFENGETATKAITISLLEDGTFFASFDDYKISEADSFVKRTDSEAIPRDILYAQGSTVMSGIADAPLMVCVNDKLYKQSKEQISYTEMKDEFVYLGKVESDVTNSQSMTDGVPKENFQANSPIVGAQIYQYGDDIVVETNGNYWLYEYLEGEHAQDAQTAQETQIEQTKWGITLSVKNATPAGLTLVCTQSGGVPTGQLQTGSFYKLLVWRNESWQDVPCLNENVVWTEVAYMIPMEDRVEWEIEWKSLYGELSAGTYRIVKRIDDFRKTGDYDTEECWAEFEIK